MSLGSNKNIVWFIVLWNLSWCLVTVAEDYNQVCVVCSSNVSEQCFDYKQAKFSAILIQSIEARLVIASPRNACQPLVNSEIPNSQFFVLIDGGSCAADVKGHYAHLKKFDAAIIRSMSSNTPQTLEGSGRYDKSLRRDLVISVGKEGGQYLEKQGTNAGCYVKITPQDIYWDFRFYLIPFAIIVGICFVLMAMFMISRYYRHYMEQRRSRLSPGKLRKIPTKKFKKGEDFYDLCAICLDEYENGDKLRILPCEHAYHCKCVDPWLTEGKRTCPVCKKSVETDNRSKGHSQDVESDETSVSVDLANERTPLISPTTRSTRSQSEINV